jgi:acid phosphatase family membrane protein YuiD
MNLSFATAPLMHEIGWACFASVIAAQVLKPFVAVLRGHRLQWWRMFDTGGMPSSHTSLVTTLTLSVGAVEGSHSILFAVSLIFCLYFVFEATGLRQEVGQQARVLNEMLDELYQTHHVDRERLRELVGHTWSEVLGGGVVGALVFWLFRGWMLRG